MPKPSDIANDVAEPIPVRNARRQTSTTSTDTRLPDTLAGVEPREEAGETAEAASAQPQDDRLSADVEAIQRERDDYYERLLRKTAEFDNYRKRVDRERREQAEYAAADVLADLLPIVDDLERALQTAPDTGVEAYRKGVELIHRQMLDLLRRRGVTAIEAVGRDFDPHVHQAVTHEVVPGHPEGEVVEEFRRGYKLRDRLLRPAMVKVAKA